MLLFSLNQNNREFSHSMNTFDNFLVSGIAPFVMREKPIDDTVPINVAVTALKATPSGSVLLVDSGTHQLSGIITSGDLTKLAEENQPKTAAALATQEVIAIRDNAQLWQLLKIMNGDNPRHQTLDYLPVVDDSNKPVGIIKREQLLNQIRELGKHASE